MADRNQLKKAVPSNQIDDDPFAELTRIMGFDPRVPVSRSQPPAVEKLAALAAEEADLSIDLEKELMGEFASLDGDVEERSQVVAMPPSRPEALKEDALGEEEDTLSDDFDFVFDANLAAEEHDPAIAAAADKALADELEAAFATQPVFSESGAVEMRGDAIAREISVDEPTAAVEAEDVLADEFETAFAAETAEEPAALVEAVREEPPLGKLETAFAEEPAAEEYEAASDAAEEEEILPDEGGEAYAAHFDDHLPASAAEEPTFIQPEMSAAPEPAESEMQTFGEQAVEPVAETDEDAEEVPLIPLGAAREFAKVSESFDANFDAAAIEVTQTFDGPSTQVGETEDDYDLEAELSALLGKGAAAGTSGKAAVTPPVEAEPVDEPLAPVAESVGGLEMSPDDDWAVDSDDPLPLVAEAAEREPIVEQEAPASHAELEPQEPTMAAESRRDAADQVDYEQPELDAPNYASVAEAPYQDEAAYPEEDDPLSEFVVEQELQAELAALEADIDFSVDDLALADEQPAYATGEDEHASHQPVSAGEAGIETAEDGTASGEMRDGPAEEPSAPVVSPAPAPVHRAHEPLPVEEEEDPFAMLAAMVRQTSIAPSAPTNVYYQDLPRSDAPIANESPAVPTNAYQYQYQNRSDTNRGPVGAPDIETVDVPESAVAFADDLDIPDVAFEDDVPLAADFDDFEAELAAAFNQQVSTPHQPAPEPVRAEPHDAYQHEYAQHQQPAAPTPGYLGGAAAAVAAVPAYAATQPAAHAGPDDRVDLDRDVLAADQARGDYHALDDDDLAYDPEMNEDMAIPPYQEAAGRQGSGSRRPVWIAAIVGGVALVGGIGAYALTGGNGMDAPALVRADTDPVKVRPENPGGSTVPNQDNKVFQTMNGTDTAAAPTQEKLISGTEEPVDVAARAEPRVITPQSAEEGEEAIEDAPLMADDAAESAMAEDPIAAEIAAAPKGEDRVAPDAEAPAANNETLAVAPRRVRTMVVRPDGTLVPSEEPAPVAAQPQVDDAPTASALEPADPTRSLSDPIAPESTGSLKPSDETAATPAPVETAAAPAPVEPVAAPKPAATQSGMPASGPVAPSRPADQPVDVVGEVKPQQVATAGGAAAVGGWSMQIASQPSEAAAKSSYEDLARRYGGVIGGRGVNIVKADVAGKGTFWRVRVPAGTRNEAISLCESYKAAGGNCFVSK
jgi:SPOR domain